MNNETQINPSWIGEIQPSESKKDQELPNTLGKKILKIMNDVYIRKNGTTPQYKYVRESDVIQCFSEQLIKHKIIMTTSVIGRECLPFVTVKDKRTAFLITVKIQCVLQDIETNEKIVLIGYGDGVGRAEGDKGIYSAITCAHKYLLLKTFLVPTNDDVEGDKFDRIEQDIIRDYYENSLSPQARLELIAKSPLSNGDFLRKKYIKLSPTEKKEIDGDKIKSISSSDARNVNIPEIVKM